MKINVYLMALAMLFVSCNNKADIAVFNNSEADRTDELVEICLCKLEKIDPSRLVVLNANGVQLPIQLTYRGEAEPQGFLFPVSLKAGEKEVFTVKEGNPVTVQAKTFVRHIPERKDDIAWENDRIAYRVYGPALKAENPSNGIDIWYKRTNELIVDKWYKNELSHIASYHEDHGEGLDCYKVAHTLGAGAIAPFTDDSLWVFNHYNRFKILDNGPLQSSFVLYYDTVRYCSHLLKVEVVITINAGSNLNEARVIFTGDTVQYRLAAGIYLHDSIQSVIGDVEKGFIGYAEDLLSQTKTPVPSGRGYTGLVFLSRLSEVKQISNHLVGISQYKSGEVFSYYFGAGWSKFGFKTDQDWFAYLANQRKALMYPLQVAIKR
jgi:hypothetical protein